MTTDVHQRRIMSLALNSFGAKLKELDLLEAWLDTLVNLVNEHDLDAEIVFCGMPTDDYLKAIGSEDPTPWCHTCGASTKERCTCLPIAEND